MKCNPFLRAIWHPSRYGRRARALVRLEEAYAAYQAYWIRSRFVAVPRMQANIVYAQLAHSIIETGADNFEVLFARSQAELAQEILGSDE